METQPKSSFITGSLGILYVDDGYTVIWTPLGRDVKGHVVYGRSWQVHYRRPRGIDQVTALMLMAAAVESQIEKLPYGRHSVARPAAEGPLPGQLELPIP